MEDANQQLKPWLHILKSTANSILWQAQGIHVRCNNRINATN